MAQKTSKNQTKRLGEAALYVIARKGWQGLTLDDVAAKAKISLKTYKSRNDLLPVIVSYMDERMLAGIPASFTGSFHDRLFEILMARFDAFQSHRKAMLSIFHAIPREPKAVCAIMPCIRTSASLVIGKTGMTGCRTLNTLTLFGIMAATARIWAKDESPDLAKTMSALDKHIAQAEKIGIFN